MTEQPDSYWVDEYHAGKRAGLERSKEIFRQTTAKRGCRRMLEGYRCNCFQCIIDSEIAAEGVGGYDKTLVQPGEIGQ